MSLIVAGGTPTAGQVLDNMRSEVREPTRKRTPTRTSQESHPSVEDDCERDGFFDAFSDALAEKLVLAGATTAFVGATSPLWAPRLALEDEGEPGFFPKYPYQNHRGSLLFDESRRGAHSSLLVLSGDYGTDLDSLSQGHIRVFGERGTRFGFDTETFFRREALRPGTDELWHGDFNLTYRFAQSEQWQFRAGVGVNWLRDDLDTDYGINATYGAEWFPRRPWVLTSSLDWGRIGSTSLLHFRNTVGVTRSGWGLFTGHDFLRVGGDEIHSWVAGLEYRF